MRLQALIEFYPPKGAKLRRGPLGSANSHEFPEVCHFGQEGQVKVPNELGPLGGGDGCNLSGRQNRSYDGSLRPLVPSAPSLAQ